MNILRDILKSIPFERECLISKSEKITYGDLSKIIEKNKTIINELKFSNVVINSRSRFEFTKLLFLLDGEVNSILFLPQDIDDKLHKRYFDETDINFEVFLENDLLKYTVINKNLQTKDCAGTKWIIPTSGTTNIPKLVSHTFATLTRTSKSNIEQGNKYRWGLVFDIYRFSGIQVYLQAMFSGSTLIVSENDMTISETVEYFSQNDCNILSGTASFWRKILMTEKSSKLDFNVITLGGEIADENVLKALKNKFPTSKIIHIYASTEAGVGFSVHDGLAGFPTQYLENGFADVSFKISKNNTLMIKNKEQVQQYIGDNKLYGNDGFIDTGDIVKIEHNRVYFLGRETGSINVGGNKVQPEEVEHALLDSGLINAAFVYPKKNPMIGNLVCADVILKNKSDDIKTLKSELLQFCRARLEKFKIPAIIKIVDNLEITQSGKIKRK